MLAAKGALFLTDADVGVVFDWKGAADALADAYAATLTDAMLPPRAIAKGDGVWLRTMTGVAPNGSVMGAKFIAAAMRSGRVSYLIPLFDQTSSELVALLDGNSITGMRTAATTALAASKLCPDGSLRLAVIGSGFEARTHVRALAAVRQIEHVAVFSPNPDSRTAFIDALQDLGIPMTSSESSEEAVASGDVILCAARSRDETPVILGSWLRPGMTVLSIGSTIPEQREIDSETVARADLIIADMVEEVLHDTGDMIVAAKDGIDASEKTIALADVIGGRHIGRSSDDAIVLYKSVGSAIQDITVAHFCVTRAEAQGVGTRLPVTIAPVQKGKPGKKP